MSPPIRGQFRIKTLIEGLIERLEKPDATRYVIMRCLCIIGMHNRLQADYERNYAYDGRPLPEVCSTDSRAQQASGKSDAPPWRPFPKCPIVIKFCRIFNSLYMIYILLKYFFSEQIELILGRFIELKLPIHCYLVGRFILTEKLASMSAALFSSAFLVWLLYMVLTKPLRVNAIYFLVQPEEDRAWIYSRLKSEQQQLELIPDMNYLEQFSVSERFLIDTMCYKVVYDSRVVFKLRANRTPEANSKLRRRTAILALACIFVYVTISTVLTIMYPTMHLLDQRYVRVYSNCDPDLERLNREGKLSFWSMTLNPHHGLTFVADITENSVVWFECGLMTIIPPLLLYLCNYDLSLQWWSISKKIDALERTVRQQLLEPSESQVSCPKYRYELGAEIADFIGQVEVANRFSAHFLHAAVVGSLSFCALYTYMLCKTPANDVPLPLILTFLYIGIVAVLCLQSFLMVHYAFSSSYTILCSLMSRDKANRTLNYGAILEFFVRHRHCALMFNKFRFMPTTFLTIIGWNITCFCFTIRQAYS